MQQCLITYCNMLWMHQGLHLCVQGLRASAELHRPVQPRHHCSRGSYSPFLCLRRIILCGSLSCPQAYTMMLFSFILLVLISHICVCVDMRVRCTCGTGDMDAISKHGVSLPSICGLAQEYAAYRSAFRYFAKPAACSRAVKNKRRSLAHFSSCSLTLSWVPALLSGTVAPLQLVCSLSAMVSEHVPPVFRVLSTAGTISGAALSHFASSSGCVPTSTANPFPITHWTAAKASSFSV